jgi:hypothetical protein
MFVIRCKVEKDSISFVMQVEKLRVLLSMVLGRIFYYCEGLWNKIAFTYLGHG